MWPMCAVSCLSSANNPSILAWIQDVVFNKAQILSSLQVIFGATQWIRFWALGKTTNHVGVSLSHPEIFKFQDVIKIKNKTIIFL